MRKAGDVVFTDVDSRTLEGIVEFSNRHVRTYILTHIHTYIFPLLFGYAWVWCVYTLQASIFILILPIITFPENFVPYL